MLVKSLSRLSRATLIDLALHWIENHSSCAPYLASNRTVAESDEEDYLFPAATSLYELRSIWKTLQVEEDAGSKQHVIDRILDGDWRRGLSLYQHATIDFAQLSTNESALRWSALRLVSLDTSLTASAAVSEAPPAKKRKTTHETQASYPTVSPQSFLKTLKSSLSPLLKSTYHLTTLSIAGKPLPVLRLYLSPTAAFAPRGASIPRSARHATDGGRVMYIALPRSSPYIYVSLAGATASATMGPAAPRKAKMDVTSMKRLVIEAIPKALSRPHERWALESTKLTTRSLGTMCELRGSGRPGTAGGAFACFHAHDEGKVAMDPSPVDVAASAYPSPPPDEFDDEGEENPMFFPEPPVDGAEAEQRAQRKRKAELDARFGPEAHTKRAKLDRVTAKIEDVCQPRGEERSLVDAAPLSVTFGGQNVHAGLRALAELGVLDVSKMPGWMAGEEGRTMISV